MGKAKPAKHTAAELAKKAADALTNKGGKHGRVRSRPAQQPRLRPAFTASWPTLFCLGGKG